MLKSSVEQDLVSKVKLPFSFKGNRAVTHLTVLTIYAEIQAIATFKGKKIEELKKRQLVRRSSLFGTGWCITLKL